MNIIKRKRKELGISQKELSEKLGTSQQIVSRLEKTSIENIPCNFLVKLADFFQIPVDVLVYGEQSDMYGTQVEELLGLYKKLDEPNKATLILLGKRLNEVQKEKAKEMQIGDNGDKNSSL